MRWSSLKREFVFRSRQWVLCSMTFGISWFAVPTAHSEIRCQEVNSMHTPAFDGAQSFGVLTRCYDPKNIGLREFFVLRSEGPFATHQYLQGALLSEVIDRSVKSKTAQSKWTSEVERSMQSTLETVVRCAQEQIRSSAPVEWRRAYQLLNFGYSESKTKKGFSPVVGLSDFENWQMAPEVYRALEHYFGSMSEGSYTNSPIAHCIGALDSGRRNRLREMLVRLERSTYRISTDSILTAVHSSLAIPAFHAASFSVGAEADPQDSTLLLSIVNEGKDYFRYLGMSRVGDSSPASLGGWNEKGLSVTLHRAPIEAGDFGGFRSERAPGAFIVHQVLRSAATVEQALSIASRVFPYNAWTLTISTPQTGDLATIEVSSKGSVISRRIQSRYLVQTEQVFSPLVLQSARYESFDELMAFRSRQIGLEREVRSIFQLGAAFRIQDFYRFFSPVPSAGRSQTVTRSILGRIGQFAQIVMAPDAGKIWVNTHSALSGSDPVFSGLNIDLKLGVVTTQGTEKFEPATGDLAWVLARKCAAQAAIEPSREARIKLLQHARDRLALGNLPADFSLDYALSRLLFERNLPSDVDAAIELLDGKWGSSEFLSTGDLVRRTRLINRTLFFMEPVRFSSLRAQVVADLQSWSQNPNVGSIQFEVDYWMKRMETAYGDLHDDRLPPFDFGQVE